jgi:hypothetical protein
MEGWVDPRAGLDDLEKRKLLTLLGLELQPFSRPARLLFGTTDRNQNLIYEEIKSRLNSDNAFYYSGHKLLYSHLVSKNVKISCRELEFFL